MLSFGYGNFWNFMSGSPAVQDLLTRPNLQLEDLLEEDGLLLELKTLNQDLLNFLQREENFRKLISYVILQPSAEEVQANPKRCHKFPFVCADVLSSDCQAIVSEFFKTQQDLKEGNTIHKAEEAEDQDEVNTDSEFLDKEQSTENSTAKEEDKSVQEGEKSSAVENDLPHINYLFTFLDSEEMNFTSAGYFAKIVNNLFAKKPSELIAYLYEQNPVLLEKMAQHVSSKSIAEFLAKVLTFESSVLLSNDNEIYNTKRKDILNLVLKKLEPKLDVEEVNNTAYLICEVLGKYNTMHCSHEILQNLLNRPTIDYFFDLLKTEDSVTCCAVALILGNIFAYYILVNTAKLQQSNEENQENDTPAMNGAPQHLELSDDIPLVAAFVSNLENIVRYIFNSSGKSFQSQYGGEVTPFGSARLKLIELIIIAMKANNSKIYDGLIEHGFLEGLLKLLVRYEWNNMLHNQIEKIITLILDSSYEKLRIALFERAKVLDFIAEATSALDFTMTGKHERKIRKGYIGHITKIANKIVQNKDSLIQEYTQNNQNWQDFVASQLADINQRNETKIGGKDPRGNNDNENEDNEEQEPQSKFPSFIQKFGNYFNAAKNAHQNDDDDDDDDDKQQQGDDDDDDDLNRAQEEEEEEEGTQGNDPQSAYNNNEESAGRYVNEAQETTSDEMEGSGSPENKDAAGDNQEIKRSVSPFSFDNEGPTNLDNVKTEETVLDTNFSPSEVWKRESWHQADDILKELEGQ